MPPRFGEVWTIKGGLPLGLRPGTRLIVSSDMYAGSGLGVLVAEIDASELRTAVIHERIEGVGVAMLDRLGWYPLSWLGERIGELSSSRHSTVTRVIRNLIGNDPL